MTKAPSAGHRLSLGTEARRLRVSQQLTQQEVASLAGVSPKNISLLEQDLPLPMDIKLRVLKELWDRAINLEST